MWSHSLIQLWRYWTGNYVFLMSFVKYFMQIVWSVTTGVNKIFSLWRAERILLIFAGGWVLKITKNILYDFQNLAGGFNPQSRTSLVPMDLAARGSHTRLAQMVADMIFDCPELGLPPKPLPWTCWWLARQNLCMLRSNTYIHDSTAGSTNLVSVCCQTIESSRMKD